jgi:heavy metal translocating P-type ATPase
LLRLVRTYPLPAASLTLLALSGVLMLLGQERYAQWPLMATILLGGMPLLWQTMRQIVRGELSVDLIAILAIAGSAVLGEYLAGALVVLMLSGGEALEAYALRQARSSLSALAERAPRVAHVWEGDTLITIPAEDVRVDMVTVVRPGELIPVDGVVTGGLSSVSEADLTGEPVPVRKEAGMQVLSGSVNLDGVLDVRATRSAAESKYAQIVQLVREAQERKAPIHRLADRYSVGFTAVALALAGLAWALSGDSVYALAVLVVATPCPLILATPIAIMSGINVAARSGIILKSGGVVELLGEVDVAVFDKTGTLTLGTPKLVAIVSLPVPTQDKGATTGDEDELLRLAASVEQLSAHILARAVVEAARERGSGLAQVSGFEEVFGKGVRGEVADTREGGHRCQVVAVGNRTYMRQLQVPLSEEVLTTRARRVESGEIVSFLAVDGQLVALLVFADVSRPELARLAPDLKRNGIRQTVLLTGDGERAAERVGAAAGVDRVIARCLPDDKVEAVRALEGEEHRVLMVGDGVNDAPALAAATVGVALGAQGITAAASAADAVLVSTDILRVVTAVRTGRHVMRVARQGIWVGIGLSTIAMIFAAFGYIEPAAGAILQEGIDVLVILNALRAGRQPSAQPQTA